MSNEWDDVAVGWDDDEAVRSYTAAAHTSLLEVLASADKSLDGAKVLDFGLPGHDEHHGQDEACVGHAGPVEA